MHWQKKLQANAGHADSWQFFHVLGVPLFSINVI